MAGTNKRIAGPAYLSNAVANIYTPPASAIVTTIRHIHVANVTGAAVVFTLYVGGTGGSTGGTELFKAVSVPANAYVDYYPVLPMLSTDFLTGVAGSASALTITVEGDQTVL